MREILFRGKRIDNGEWVEGHYHYAHWYLPPSMKIVDTTHHILPIGHGDSHKVAIETVGQFTGLTDKNGKKIFEGDIVRILGNQDVEDWKNVDYTALIAFIDGGFCAIDGTVEEHGFRRYALARLDFSLEVIGNIHDNPEIMEVSE